MRISELNIIFIFGFASDKVVQLGSRNLVHFDCSANRVVLILDSRNYSEVHQALFPVLFSGVRNRFYLVEVIFIWANRKFI